MAHKLLLGIASGLLVLLSTGCIVSVEPERATNQVGTEHTVTLTLRDPEALDEDVICDIFDDIRDGIEEEFPDESELPPIAIPVPVPCVFSAAPAILPETQLITFEVISGPNLGQTAEFNGVCAPSCFTLQEETSWTYRSNGVPGTDTILACVDFFALLDNIIIDESSTAALTPEEALDLLEEIVVDAVNDALDTDYEILEDLFCRTVSKTWVDRNDRPNIGAGLSGLFQGQPTALPTAPAPVAVAPNQGIRPPNTGDAGLR